MRLLSAAAALFSLVLALPGGALSQTCITNETSTITVPFGCFVWLCFLSFFGVFPAPPPISSPSLALGVRFSDPFCVCFKVDVDGHVWMVQRNEIVLHDQKRGTDQQRFVSHSLRRPRSLLEPKLAVSLLIS
jgi:hypothetical protein